jgi:hypothetical protein
MTACCPWCGRAFRPRTSGGSDQRFCGASCRHAFWSAARRWVMRAVDAGLLSPDTLNAVQTSVHAAPGAFPARERLVCISRVLSHRVSPSRMATAWCGTRYRVRQGVLRLVPKYERARRLIGRAGDPQDFLRPLAGR